MKKTTNAVFLIAIVLLLIGGSLLLKSLLDGPKDTTAAPKPTVTQVVYMSTDGVIENIERRLTQVRGRQIKATCPKKVDRAIGTKFTCDVAYAGTKKPIAQAAVKIDGPRGEFSWKSQPLSVSTPSPTS